MVKTKGNPFKETCSIIVSADFTRDDDKAVLIIGEQIKGKVTVVNAFQGSEAIELWQKLVTQKPKVNA